MPGRGPAPKANRQRGAAPARGDWVDLQPLTEPILPELPEGDWSARAADAWADWRSDPVTQIYGIADIRSALDLLYVYEEWVWKGGAQLHNEVRQMQDRLGLNPKGRQDLRLRVIEADEPEVAANKPAAKRPDVRAV